MRIIGFTAWIPGSYIPRLLNPFTLKLQSENFEGIVFFIVS